MSDGNWTRRNFLETLGAVGGATAVYEAMTAMGLIRIPEAFGADAPCPQPPHKGASVVILGAGVAGLTAAYEMLRAGWTVTVLEAQNRIGGRNFTVRQNDVIHEIDDDGKRVDQVCQFDKGLYLNAGPGRIPYHHTAVLRYCRELKVALEVYDMSSSANFFQNDAAFNEKPEPRRRIENDTRGYIAELLAKVVNRGALDQELSPNDKAALLSLLTQFGTLDVGRYYAYTGSQRSGYSVQPAIVTPGREEKPLSLQQLLKSQFWLHRFYQPEDYEWQRTLFQPVGGMDGIVKGFENVIPSEFIHKNRQVREIEISDRGVKVVHSESGSDEKRHTTSADWCISTIPLPLLRGITSNFSDDYRTAVASVSFAPTCKVGWQAERRFWEEDDEMYGGISYINHNITQMWYPSNDYFTQKGTLTGAYNYEKRALVMGNMTPAERLALAYDGALRMHPQFRKDVDIKKGITIAWQNVPYQRGGWADWQPEQDEAYRRLLQPDRRFFVAGDQMSYLPGWQEGAIRSACYVMNRISRPAERLDEIRAIDRAPDAQRRTRGWGEDVEDDE